MVDTERHFQHSLIHVSPMEASTNAVIGLLFSRTRLDGPRAAVKPSLSGVLEQDTRTARCKMPSSFRTAYRAWTMYADGRVNGRMECVTSLACSGWPSAVLGFIRGKRSFFLLPCRPKESIVKYFDACFFVRRENAAAFVFEGNMTIRQPFNVLNQLFMTTGVCISWL